ncbi:MAG: hypothetical protein A3F40_00065 [Chlamydiae bacterium RIFCSPHIGHO2_12_FULL_27_8]|nr:MAG: hypothetical protein A3F40_00065 [Chlamydiae bacterium RIFCSPHIGHO2_12_FULL_27_8]OGN65568.1 MAG: hypothetical protein A2888_00045 [Chlamydiae bacterium RIFCSPLOWO2_01_FULL_28_7]
MDNLKKIALFPNISFGDSLLFMIIAQNFKKAGYEIFVYHDNFINLKSLFPNFHFKKVIEAENLEKFEKIFFQNDDKERTINFKNFREKKSLDNISILYFRYVESKHGILHKNDLVLNDKISCVDSILELLKKNFEDLHITSDTGIILDNRLIHKKHSKRIILHPTSSDKNKNWDKKKYIKLAKILQMHGFDPVITVSKEERNEFLDVLDHGIDLPLFLDIKEFINFLYESSFLIGNDSFAPHLASLLNIQTIVIASSKKLLKLWRPGWLKPILIFPPSYIPNIKHFRIRERYFSKFIKTKKVYKKFIQAYINQ